MSEATGGAARLLAVAAVYSRVQQWLARADNRAEMVGRYLRPRPGDRVIDIGCGPADILAYLPAVEYHGFDRNPDYIRRARAVFGSRGQFYEQDARSLAGRFAGSADLVIAAGLLHHLDDAAAGGLFATGRDMLRPGGRMVTIDPVLCTPQHPLARLAIRMDRGRHVRTAPAYRSLAETAFAQVEAHLRSDLMRIPYTHLILECAG